MDFIKRSIGLIGIVLFDVVFCTVPVVQRAFWRNWYNRLSRDPQKLPNWTFMNYGYRDTDPELDTIFWQWWEQLDLRDIDPAFYDLARLYYEVCSTSVGALGEICSTSVDGSEPHGEVRNTVADGEPSDDLDNAITSETHSREFRNAFAQKNVLEIGSGRGGGAAFVARHFKPAKLTGVDIASTAVQFCRNKFADIPNLQFQQGDAIDLPFAENTYDVAINIESSHCYSNFKKFVKETQRVLKKDGLFYFADFRNVAQTAALKDIFINAGFSIVHQRDITANVLKSLECTSTEKKSFLKRTFPRVLQPFFRTFAGLQGTFMYEQFAKHEMIYSLFVLRND